MTLALYGKSRGRQATLVVVALFAVLLAGAGALWQMQQAFAHHPAYVASAQCDGTWSAAGSYTAGDSVRLILISDVKVNGQAYQTGWTSGVGGSSTGPVLLSAFGGSTNGLPAAGAGVYVVQAASGDSFTVFNRTQSNTGSLDLSADWGGFIRQYFWNGSAWQEGGTGSGFQSTVDVTAPTAPGDCVTIKKVQVGGTAHSTFRADINKIAGTGGSSITNIDFEDDAPETRPVDFDGLRDWQVIEDSYSDWTTYYWYSTASSQEACPAADSAAWTLGRTVPTFVDFPDRSNVTVCFKNVKKVPDLEVTKSDSPDPVMNGQDITYTITITNVGGSDVTKTINLNDQVPANTKLVSIAENGRGSWSCSPDNLSPGIYLLDPPTYTGNIACSTNDDFSGGESTTFTVVVRVNAGFCGEISNTATISTTGTLGTGDSNSGNNSATATTQSTGCTPNTVKIKIAKVLVGAESTDTFTADLSGSATENDIQFSTSTSPERDVPYNGTYTLAEDTPGGGYTYSGYAIVGFDAACPLGSNGAAWTEGPATLTNLTQDKKVCFRNGVVEGEVDCEGGDLCGLIRSPGFWKNWDNHFTTTQFQTIVTDTGTGLTIAQVEGYLNDTGQQCDRHLMAALLNLSWHSEFGGGIWNGGGPFQGMTISQILALASPGNCAEDGDGNATDFDSVDDLVRYLGAGGETGPCLILPPDCVKLVAEKTQRVGDTPYTDQPINGLKPGDTVFYRLSVKNTGQDPVTNLDIDDTLPASGAEVSETLTPPGSDPGKCSVSGPTVDCNDISLPVGAEFVLIVSMTLPAGNANFGCEDRFTNKFTYDSDQTDSKDSNTVTGVMEDCTPGAKVEKTVVEETLDQTGPYSVGLGTTFDYKIVVTNTGNTTLQDVFLTDTDLVGGVFTNVVGTPAPDDCSVPPESADFTCDLGDMEPGDSSEFIVTVRVNRECANVTNTAHVRLGTEEGESVDDSTAPTVTVTGCLTDLKPEKFQSEFAQGDGVKDDLDVDAGQTLYYWLKVTNDGNQTVNKVAINDTFPSAVTVIDDGDGTCELTNGDKTLNCVLDELAEDGVWLVKVSIVVPRESAGSECGDDVRNVFTVDSDETDEESSNSVLATVPDCAPAYTLTKEQSEFAQDWTKLDIDVVNGQDFWYKIVITNTGNETIFGLDVDDTLPLAGSIESQGNSGTGSDNACSITGGTALDCTIDTLYPDATYTIVIKVTVPEEAECGTTYTNSVSTSENAGIDGKQTEGIDAHTPECDPEVKVKKDPSAATVVQGDTFTYTIKVWNDGNVGQYVYLDDTLSGPGDIISVSSPNGAFDCETATYPAGDFLCDLGVVPVLSEANAWTFTVTVRADAGLRACETIDNRADIREQVDNKPGREIWTDDTGNKVDVIDCGDPYVEKSVEEDIESTEFGQLITYNIKIGNNGSSTAYDVVVEDNLTNGLIVATDMPSGCQLEGTIPTATGFTCRGNLDPFSDVEFSITVKVSESCEPLDNEIHLIFDAEGQQYSGGNLDTTNDSDSTGNGVTVTGCAPSINVEKNPPASGSVQFGGTFFYDIVVTNGGNANSGPFQVVDSLSGNGVITGVDVFGDDNACESNFTATGFTCQFEDLGFPPGANSITIRVFVQAGSAECTPVDNAVIVSSVGENEEIDERFEDSDVTDNAVSVVGCQADPAVQKSDNDADNIVQIGGQFTYTITVSNLGNAAAGNVVLSDTLVNGSVVSIESADGAFDCEVDLDAFPCTIGVLGIGQSVSFTVTVQAAEECLQVENTASVANIGEGGNLSTSNDQDAADNIDIDGCDVDVDGSKAQGTNGVNFSASVLPLTPGGSVLYYQITATNVGNQVLNNVSITDGAPAGTSFIGIENDGGGSCTAGSPFTCTIGTLGVGQSYTIVFSVQVANVECGLTVSNAATIAAGSSGTAGPGTGTEATNSVDAELDPCGTLIVDKTTVVNGVVNINDDDGWVITIASEDCNFEAQAVTNAAGVAIFANIPACDDYVVTEVIALAPVDGYEPDGSPTVGGVVVPANGVATVSFVNVREDEEPTATPTGTATSLPTNTPVAGQTVAGETVVATNTPDGTSTKVGGATVVATGTPLAPSTGNGIFGSGAGANLTLALFGMFAVGGGLILIAFGRRTRDQA